MRILFFYHTEFGSIGGVESVVWNMSTALKSLGHTTAIMDFSTTRKAFRLHDNSVPLWSIVGPSFPTPRRPRSWASYARAVWQFESVMWEFRPDIVHVHFPLGQCLPTVGAYLLPHRWRVVATVHNSDIRVSPVKEPRLRAWQERLFRRSDAVTSVSRELLDDTIQKYPCVLGKGKVVHNGVGEHWFREMSTRPVQNSNVKYVLFTGRLHPMKAVDDLLRAWKLAQGSLGGLQLWVAGDGAERAKLESMARDLDLGSTVKFLGSQVASSLPELYRNALLVVLPSRHEGFPMVLLEAGACGAVCIGTRVSGIREIIQDGVNGFLADPASPESLSECIKRVALLSDEEKLRVAASARELIRTRFTQEMAISKYLDIYAELLDGKRNSRIL